MLVPQQGLCPWSSWASAKAESITLATSSDSSDSSAHWTRLAERCTARGPGSLGAWEGMLQPESITKSIHFILLSMTGEIFRSDFGAKLHFVMEVLLNRRCVAWTKVVLELCDNPEKLVGYWLFASSGTVVFFILQPMASVRRKPSGGRKNGTVHGVLTWLGQAEISSGTTRFFWTPGLFALILSPRPGADPI